MMIHYETTPGEPLSIEQEKEIENAVKMEPVFDDDCPELPPAMMKSLKAAVRNRNRANALQLNIIVLLGGAG